MLESNTKFVNSLFLKNLLEHKFHQENVKIKSYKVEPGTSNAMANFRSLLCRILVNYSSRDAADQSLVVVLKLKPFKGDNISEDFGNSNMFEKEMDAYKRVIPSLIKCLNGSGIKISFTPECIESGYSPSSFLIMEDMSQKGYATVDRTRGLNYEESKMALEKLAFFHAASVVAFENVENSKFAAGTFHTSKQDKLNFFEEAFKAIVDNASTFGVENEVIKKMKTLPEKLIQKGIEDYTSCFNGFKVLNHGDFWTNNILFRYDGNELQDVIFIDFQNCFIGSPIVDLLYFLTTSVCKVILEEAKDEFVYLYYETLTIILKKLGFKGTVPKLIDFQMEILKRGALEVIFALTTAPYLRSHSQVQPEIAPALTRSLSSKADTNSVLAANADDLKQKINAFDSQGLLDWGTRAGKVRGLLGNFQKI